MSNFINDDFTALNNAIVFYCGQDISLTVPEKLGNMNINLIGQGAFMESEKLYQVVIKEGIKEIGASSFSKCKMLTNVFIPNTTESVGNGAFRFCDRLTNLNFYRFRLSVSDYRFVKSGVLLNGGRYLISDISRFAAIQSAVDALDVEVANPVKHNVRCIFTSRSLNEDKGRLSMFRNLEGFGFDGSQNYSSEIAEFKKLSKKKSVRREDFSAEKNNDLCIRTEKENNISKTALISLDDSQTKLKNGYYYVFINVKIGLHFWQSAVPVCENGKMYYIYQRHYLTDEEGLDYIRKDVAVFTEDNELVNDRKEAERVYAKYRLLTIL